MQKFKELVSLCKNSVEIAVNDHKDVYETVEQYIKEAECREYIEDEVYQEMINKNTVVKVQAYPDNSIGSYSIYHYDIDKAVEIALNLIKNEKALL